MHIIEDDENSYSKPANPWKSEPQQAHPRGVDMKLTKYKQSKQWNIPIVEPNIEKEGMSYEALILRYHRKFGHISFSRLQEMANAGVIPKRLKKCRIPMCSACMYANTTKRP